MKIGLMELIVIGFTALLIFGTRRIIKVKESFKKAISEFKSNLNKEE